MEMFNKIFMFKKIFVKYKIKLKISVQIFIVIFAMTTTLYAATSTNFNINVQNENSGASNLNSSTNFSIGCSEFGKMGEGVIASALYSITSNLPCEIPSIGINFRFAPEKRVPIPAPNLDMKDMRISLRTIGSPANSTPLTISNVVSDTDVNGFSITPALINISPGSYDIFIKSAAHLNQKYGTVNITGASTTVDFTQGLTQYAKAGDVNGTQFGDDKINSLDISVTIANLGLATYRPDTNQDGYVNALDIGILLANLNQIGE
jgi:hypothetical protein